MAITAPSANFTTEHEKKHHAPVYICEIMAGGATSSGSGGGGGYFGGLYFGGFGSGGSAPPALAKFSTVPMEGCLPYAELPQAQFPKVDTEQSNASLGSIVQPIKDINNAITGLLAQGLKGRVVVFKCGYWPQVESDFATYATYIIDDFELLDDGLTWMLYTRDPGTLSNITVFECSATTLWSNITASDTTIPVVNGQYFLDSGYFIIDQEMMSYAARSVDDSGQFWNFSGVTRGVEGTQAAAHSVDNAIVSETLVLQGHPLDIAIAAMTNTDKTGGSISEDLIDLAAFDEAKGLVGSSLVMKFYITEPENLKTWIESQIYRPLACYPRVTGTGQQSIVVFRQPTPDRVAGEIDDSEIVDPFPPLRGNQDSLRNAGTCLYDWNPIVGAFANSLTYDDSASIAQYGRHPLPILESKGFRSEFANTERNIRNRLKAKVKRYRQGAFILPLQTRFHSYLIEAGDIVSVTCDVVPNARTGTRGITDELYEVIGRGIDFEAGLCQFELEKTDWTGTISVIAPSGAPIYTGATTRERQTYMWIADGAGLNPDATAAPVIGTA